jgi:hypothetical protein
MILISLIAFTGCADMGPLGPEGPRGEEGPEGPRGEEGQTGLQGIQGNPGEDGEVGEDGKKGFCAIPADTIIMQYEWVQAQSYRNNCLSKSDFHYEDCILNATVNYHDCVEVTGQDQAGDGGCFDFKVNKNKECDESWNQQDYECHNWYAKRVNKIPLRVCGTRIFDNSDGGLPKSEHGNVESMMVVEEDSDGDGISNWMEFLMGYNPCTPHSFGLCIDDADLDYDVDGIPDGEDDFPICNPDDPGEYPSDCV